MEIIRMQIANEAIAFYDVGSREYSNHMPALIENPQENFYKILPAIVNLSFSIELFLKTFLKDEDGRRLRHDLKALLENWGEPEKSLIITAVLNRMRQYNSSFSETMFWEHMNANKFAFEDWRYYYQRGDHVDITFIFVVSSVLRDFVIKFKEAGL